MRDSEFIRGKVPMTKEEVRAVVLSKLQLQPSDTLMDVGAGTGSVAIEAALRLEKGQVIAVEQKAEAVDLIRQNARKHKVDNINIILGKAPKCFPDISAVNKVFVGGSGGNLGDVLALISKNTSTEIVVVSAIVVDTMMQAYTIFRALDGFEVELVQVAVSKVEPDKRPAMLLASNPIFIVTARKKKYNG